MNKHIVIVGAGQAGVAVAFKLRSLGHTGNITLIGDEPDLPYHRPPLSKKYITNISSAERLSIKQKSLYETERIALLLDYRVVAIERENKRVIASDGSVLNYDILVLATGARARRLSDEQGGNASNVYTLRTLADATRLRDAFVEDRHLLIIGGGYIGLECAAVARSLGMHVTLIERDNRILGRVACTETAGYFRKLHRDQGVTLLEGIGIEHLTHSEDNTSVATLSNGSTLSVDVVVVGVGVSPEIHLAQQADLLISNGITVDAQGRTADPSIYAVGDCACFPYKNREIRLESVQNAIDMATVVARSIAGEPVEYVPAPWFWSDQYATKLQIAGLNMGYTRVAVRHSSDSVASIWYYEHDRLISVDAINDSKAFMTAKRWLSDGYSPDYERIADSSMSLDAVASI